MKSAKCFGSKFSSGGTRWSWAPAAKAPKISKTDKSKCKGGCPEIRSDALIPKYWVAQSTKWITLEWVMTTPLGVPVEPEVKRMYAGSSGSFRESGGFPG